MRFRQGERADLRHQLFVWACLALVPILNWPATALPFERDEGEYLWAATIATRGSIPYRDVFLQKPPGIIHVYRALLAITDGSPRALHLILLAVYVLTAAGIGAIAWRLTGRAVATAASITLYALSLSTPLYQASAANTESFVVLATVVAVYALIKARETGSLAWIALVGVGVGVAITMKQTAAPSGLWLLAALAFVAPRTKRWRWLLVAALAATVVLAIVFLPYVVAGAGREMLDAIVWHNLEYTTAKLEHTQLDVTVFHVALWLAALIGLALLFRKRDWWSLAVLGGWTLSAWIGVSAGAVYRGHYFLLLLPPIAILAAFTLASASRLIRIAAVPLTIIYWVLSSGLQWTANEATLAGQRYHTLMFQNTHLVGSWLREQPDRSLYVLASEPEIYYYADAVPATRYVIQNPLFGGFTSSSERQREVWAGIQRSHPRWIVTVFPPDAIPFFPGSNPALIKQVDQLLSAEYAPRMAAVREKILLLPIDSVPNTAARQLTIWERRN